MTRHSGIDPFLFHVPETEESVPKAGNRRNFRHAFRDGPSLDQSAGWLPVLVRLPHPDFEVPDNLTTKFVPTSRLGYVMSGRGTKAALIELGKLPGVVVEVSREGGTWELEQSLLTVGARDVQAVESAEVEDRCIVGVIDGGIDPMHHAFLGRDGNTRLLYIWDQTSDGPRQPSHEGLSFKYGSLFTEVEINQALKNGPPLVISPKGNRVHLEHGTHVTSIAAGRRVIDPNVEYAFSGGMAPDAPIVFVIPALGAVDGRSSQGFAKSHLDALSFIDAVAKRRRLPVVVNVSAGIAAGAHDGSSALEASFDSFTVGGQAPGRAVVKSAGNDRGAQRYRRFKLATSATVPIRLTSLGLARGTTVEAWFSSAHDVELTVNEGDRGAMPILSRQQPKVTAGTQQGTAYLSYERFHRDNGDTLLLLTSLTRTTPFTGNCD